MISAVGAGQGACAGPSARKNPVYLGFVGQNLYECGISLVQNMLFNICWKVETVPVFHSVDRSQISEVLVQF